MKSLTNTERRLQKARTALLLDHPFFGSLLSRLKGRESRSIKTMATDGVSLFYNPDFVDTLNAATLCGVLAHEVLHPGLQHHVHRSGRDPNRWNEACDYAINPILLDAGMHLPDGVLVEDRYREMSAEQIYNQLQTEAEQEPSDEDDTQEAGGDGAASPQASPGDSDDPSAPVTKGGIGQVLDAPAANEEVPTVEEQVREWSVAVNQAVTLPEQAGKVPAGMKRSLDGAADAFVDWRELLRRASSETAPADFSWMRPDRRHICTGLYLSGVVREGVGEVAIAVDCSASVNSRQLCLFEAEVRSILEGQRPERVYVLYFDATVNKVETFEAGQRVSLSPVGGEGTEFGPCFEWLDEHAVRPQTLVFLTDLYGSFPDSNPHTQSFGLPPGADGRRSDKLFRCRPPDSFQSHIRRRFNMERSIRIFTDGSAIGNPGPGGWGAVVIDGKKLREMSGALPWTDISEMELVAAVEALRSTPIGSRIELYSDSELRILGMRGFVSRWESQGWRNRRGVALQHRELWLQLIQLNLSLEIRRNWLRGHNGHRWQSRADALAYRAARSLAVPQSIAA